jgi:hypothetical protein
MWKDRYTHKHQAWRYISTIPAFRSLRQEDYMFETYLLKPHLKKCFEKTDSTNIGSRKTSPKVYMEVKRPN